MEKAFEEYLKKTNLSENTKKSYQTAVKQFFGMYMTVDNSNLRSYKTHLIEEYKPKTVNLRIRAINCFLDNIEKSDLKLSSIKCELCGSVTLICLQKHCIVSKALKNQRFCLQKFEESGIILV